jgi:hypothetical protein
MYLIAESEMGISSNQLHRILGVTVKPAWFMSQRICEAIRSGTFTAISLNSISAIATTLRTASLAPIAPTACLPGSLTSGSLIKQLVRPKGHAETEAQIETPKRAEQGVHARGWKAKRRGRTKPHFRIDA